MQAERLWQTALVVEDAAGRRWLEFPDVSRCRRCREGTGCGAAQWSRLFGARQAHRLPLPPGCEFMPGTPVRAGLSSRALLTLALRAYLLPLLAFLALLLASRWVGLAEWLALALGVAAVLATLRYARRAALRGLEPRIERLTDETGPDCGALESEAR